MTYDIVFDRSSPIIAIIFSVNVNLEVNFVSESIHQLGYTPEDFSSSNRSLLSLFRLEDQHHFQQILSELREKDDSSHSGEYQIITADGRIVWVKLFLTGRADLTEDIPRFQMTFSDINMYKANHAIQEEQITLLNSKRLRLEKALKENDCQYRNLIQTKTVFIAHINVQGRLTFVNDLYCTKLQKSRSELIEKEYITFMLTGSGADDSETSEFVWKDSEYSIPLRAIDYINTVDGWRWIAWNNSPILDENGAITEYQCVGHDITILKKKEEKMLVYQNRMQSLAAEMSMLEERQRRKIAQSIHDNIGQILANCTFLLESLKLTRGRKEYIPKIQQIQEFISTAIKETRALTFELSPPILYEFGLEKALHRLTEQILKIHNIHIYFENDNNSENLSGDSRGFLFQATRELLVNIVKHAKAKSVTVSIFNTDSETNVRVKDDGIGFVMNEILSNPEKLSCFGLFSISERIHFLGGHVNILSKPGIGTEITLSLPNNKDHTQ